jgi:hypothetical protein
MGDAAVDRSQFPTEAPPEERRRSPRTRMIRLVYLNMQPENGGRLLDVSSTGLGFQASDPIAIEAPTRFRLSAGWIDDIEFTGDLVWLDDSRKRAGLRFGQLPEVVRKQIQVWVGRSERPSPPVQESSAVSQSLVDNSTPLASPTRNQPGPGSAGPAAAPVSGPPGLALDPTPPAGAPNRPYPSPPLSQWGSLGVQAPEGSEHASRRGQRLGTVALVVAVLLLVAGVGVFAFLNKREVGESLIRLGEGLSGEHAPQPAKAEASATLSSIGQPAPESASSASAPGAIRPPGNVHRDSAGPAPASSSVLGSTSRADRTQPSAEARQPEPKPHAEGVRRSETSHSPALPETKNSLMKPASPGSEAAQGKGDGRKELALARQYLRGAGVRQDRAVAAHLLWVAVGLGNTQAELELADLYLQGEGAPGRNCEQARILLTVATHSGNVVAGQKLAELRDHGCR